MDHFDKLLVLPYQPSESHNYTHFIGTLTIIIIIYTANDNINIDVGDDEIFQNEKFINVLLKANSDNDKTDDKNKSV
jgi:hypothetical protein